MTRLKRNSEKGFTLIEVTLVIIIAGILLSLLAGSLASYVKNNKIKTTEFRLAAINLAIEQYLNVNRKYPCPASRVIGPDHADYGREVNNSDCTAGPFTGTVSSGGVKIGAVPTRSLNLPDEFGVDAWGQKLTYAVTEVLATSGSFVSDQGVIRVVDSAGNELVSPPSNPTSRAHFVIVSHGVTGDGGYPVTASTSPTVSCGSTTMDSENCDDDDTFRSTLITSDVGATANFYDDYIEYQGQTSPVLAVPANAVMAFNLTTCPDGWTPYTAAQGRMVIGLGPDLTRPVFTLPLPGAVNATIDLSLNTQAESPAAIIPPYISLLYCMKLP